MKIRKYLDWRHWLRGIWSAAIQGGAAAGTGATGLLGGNLVGADVRIVTIKEFAIMFIGAGIVRICFYLKEKPFPEELTEQIATPSPFPINPHDEK